MNNGDSNNKCISKVRATTTLWNVITQLLMNTSTIQPRLGVLSTWAGGSKRWTFSVLNGGQSWLYRLYCPLCGSRRIDTWHIVYLSNKDPCPTILIQCPTGTMDSDGNSQVSASKKWLALAELTCKWQLKRVNSRTFHRCLWVPMGHFKMYLNLTFMNWYCRTGILIR